MTRRGRQTASYTESDSVLSQSLIPRFDTVRVILNITYGRPYKTTAVPSLCGDIRARGAPQPAPPAPLRVQAFPVPDLREVLPAKVTIYICRLSTSAVPRSPLTIEPPLQPETRSSVTFPHTARRRCGPMPPRPRQHPTARELAGNVPESRSGAWAAHRARGASRKTCHASPT